MAYWFFVDMSYIWLELQHAHSAFYGVRRGVERSLTSPSSATGRVLRLGSVPNVIYFVMDLIIITRNI
ncbi:hypothetical protein GDO81_011546 [Engystomops pustulosus]|uniref:Uncharacterized protein n=1 Tax=Engystomops pustulosus TaxID=76066 RepID=A0AAV7BF75_ENGPU|nr:hypothetical protein GDO81_011546 [Engystomops pustulosus]